LYLKSITIIFFEKKDIEDYLPFIRYLQETNATAAEVEKLIWRIAGFERAACFAVELVTEQATSYICGRRAVANKARIIWK
jgi:hypothetical protein